MKGSLLVNISYMCQKEIMCQGKLLYANMRKVWGCELVHSYYKPSLQQKANSKLS